MYGTIKGLNLKLDSDQIGGCCGHQITNFDVGDHGFLAKIFMETSQQMLNLIFNRNLYQQHFK